MSANVVAKRYAEALFQLAGQEQASDELIGEFRIVRNLFQDNKELLPFFKHPSVSHDQKQQFIDNVFKDFSDTVTNTLKLLAERHRMAIVIDMVEQFTHLVNESRGMAHATVYSIRELSHEELARLESVLTKRYNKQSVTFDTVVDPTLIGGLKIRMGNTIIDGTISSKLQRIERNMKLAHN